MSDVVASVITLALLLLGGAVVVWLLLRAQRERRIVSETSAALAALGQLNATTLQSRTYPSPIIHEWVDWVNSKPQMDRYDLRRLLWDNLASYEQHFDAQILAQAAAMIASTEYLNAYSALGQEHLGKSTSPGIAPGKYQRIEAKFFAKQQLPTFRYSAHVRCVVRYTSPKGQNSYWRYHEWNFEGLYREFQEMRQDRAAKSTTQFLRQQERQRVTAKVRFEVFARDGNRCRVCGTTADVEPLHVDHIIPISKGGRSDLHNLQTLCQTCNLGKGNRH
jgi:5-methylcytosine-specific restriction endonuclease McrA